MASRGGSRHDGPSKLGPYSEGCLTYHFRMSSPKDDDPDKPDRVSVSRRDFLKSTGVGGIASAVAAAGASEVEAQTGPRAVGPGAVPVALTVNGKRIDLQIEPRVTLLDAVR